MKRTIVVFISLLLAVEVTQASVLRVGFGGYAPYTTIQSAITAAAPGDTIVISPNASTYGGFSVNKRLVILGAGSSPAGVYTKVSSLEVTDAGDSTTISSLWILGYSIIRSGARGVTVRDCLMDRHICGGSPALTIDSAGSVTVVRSCLWGSYGCPWGDNVACWLGDDTNLALIGCVLCGGDRAIYGGSQDAQLTISHCVLWANWAMLTWANGTVENSAFLTGWGDAANLITQYSAFAGTPPAGTGNIPLTTADFINIVTNDPVASDYHLSPESLLRDAGNPSSPLDGDGSRADIGVYGGANPYSPAGIPPFPFVTGLDVPAIVPENGVLEIHSTGRVGQGGGE